MVLVNLIDKYSLRYLPNNAFLFLFAPYNIQESRLVSLKITFFLSIE